MIFFEHVFFKTKSKTRNKRKPCLCCQNTRPPSLLDLLLRGSTEKLGLHDQRDFGKVSFAQNLVISMFPHVDDGSLSVRRRPGFFWQEADDFVQVDDGTKEFVALQMKDAHSDFAEITRMVFVEVDAVVMLATSVSPTTGMFSVFSDSTVTVAHVTPKFSRLLWLFLRHFLKSSFKFFCNF